MMMGFGTGFLSDIKEKGDKLVLVLLNGVKEVARSERLLEDYRRWQAQHHQVCFSGPYLDVFHWKPFGFTTAYGDGVISVDGTPAYRIKGDSCIRL
ncbi:MAG: hypothetical protein HYT72_05215 [Candidatus Aenigmarchaeota archaeon]|nr:hypothetical protein [Candidatus Aenigmarchaeota archaeon]